MNPKWKILTVKKKNQKEKRNQYRGDKWLMKNNLCMQCELGEVVFFYFWKKISFKRRKRESIWEQKRGNHDCIQI